LSNLDTFLQQLSEQADTIKFEDTMAIIDALYTFTPCEFKNGDQINEAGQNSGSCKLFAFAQFQSLSPQQTLNCFGQYYRDDVCQNPDGQDHQNIRNFMISGWEGIEFKGTPLSPLS
jgi:HopJ type III effector protein